MNVLFRYDDCSALSSLELEQRLAALFAEHHAQITFGVIPNVCAGSFHNPDHQELLSLPQTKAKFLREAARDGAIEVALHGWSHQTARKGAQTEFAGVAADEQRRRIVEGKQELEGLLSTSVTTFIPPWNDYDATTVRVLEQNGFDNLSGSLRGPFSMSATVTYAPYSVWLSFLSSTLQSSKPLVWMGGSLVIMLHDFDFVESGKSQAWLSLDALSALLTELRRQPDVTLCSVRQAVWRGATLSAESLGPYAAWRRCLQSVSWRYRQPLENQALWTAGAGHRRAAMIHAYQAFLSSGIVARDLADVISRKLRSAAERLSHSGVS